jgi:predicted amidohydrolase YtcJ
MHGCNQEADLVLYSSSIFTGESASPFKGAVALKGNRILEVGTREKIDYMVGESTEVMDFGDKTILPGFQDFHTHLYVGSCLQGKVDLSSATTEVAAAAMVGEYAQAHPEDDWIIGYGWYQIFWDEIALPTASSLDAVVSDRPVLLFNSEFHGCWVNSEALRICGIDADTLDPPFGKIERDKEGNASGFLYETAMKHVIPMALKFDEKTNIEKFKKIEAKALSNGITTLNDMLPLPGVELDNISTYKLLEKSGELNIRIFFEKTLNGSLIDADSAREKYSGGKVRFAGLKAFVDGVATTYTASLLEPYVDKPESKGLTLLPPDLLKEWVCEADKNGYRVRLHACGNGAVRLALDCFESAAKQNGKKGLRHAIEHIEYIDPSDVGRFRALGVIASIQPEHMAITENFDDNPYVIRHGVHCEPMMFLNKSFIDSGVAVAYASDYPIVDMTPLKHIYRAVTRVFDDGEPEGGWNPREKVSLAEALRCYTAGPAFGNSCEDLSGTLKSGKLADITVLDRDIFSLPYLQLKDAKVTMTISDGKIVFSL